MSHPPLYDVIDFDIVADYTLRVAFDDKTEQIINFESILYGPILGPLRDFYLFNQVSLDPEAGTLVWPNGADFDPTNLHNWPKDGPYFVAKAQRWRYTTRSTLVPA